MKDKEYYMLKFEQALVLFFLISIPFLIYNGTSTSTQENLNGVVIDFGATTDDIGIHSFLLVTLENNRTVKIDYPTASRFNIGKNILVHVRTTKLFGMKKYKIIKWYKKSKEHNSLSKIRHD